MPVADITQCSWHPFQWISEVISVTFSTCLTKSLWINYSRHLRRYTCAIAKSSFHREIETLREGIVWFNVSLLVQSMSSQPGKFKQGSVIPDGNIFYIFIFSAPNYNLSFPSLIKENNTRAVLPYLTVTNGNYRYFHVTFTGYRFLKISHMLLLMLNYSSYKTCS